MDFIVWLKDRPAPAWPEWTSWCPWHYLCV